MKTRRIAAELGLGAISLYSFGQLVPYVNNNVKQSLGNVFQNYRDPIGFVYSLANLTIPNFALGFAEMGLLLLSAYSFYSAVKNIVKSQI
ncbi:MAG: hypothetical protein J4452_01120 [Candidatus Aenigmarchaeota archaeon]|nr:hypothetical protein [Candidatus Aenigmarchaeota archaeon]